MAAVEDNSMAIGKPIGMKLFMAFYLLHRAKVVVWEDYLQESCSTEKEKIW